MRLLLLALACLCAGATADDIDDLMKIDVEPLLKDEAKWKELFDCLMDRRPCAGDYQKIKDVLPGIMTTKCEKCTPEQKETFEKRTKMFAEKYPQDYAELASKLSPKPE